MEGIAAIFFFFTGRAMLKRLLRRAPLCALVPCVALATPLQQPTANRFPAPEKLTYQVEWRLINAGTATVQLLRGNPLGWNLNVNIESAGLVSRLFRVSDSYKVIASNRFCVSSGVLDAQEGKRHSISRFNFDSARRKIIFEERDVVANRVSVKKELDAAACTYEIVGALASLRTMNLEPGKSIVLPVTDGKKSAPTRIEAQSRDKISVNGKSYNAIRYEAFVFDNVIYKRRGRLLIWLSDDADRIPVQFRLLIGFPVGTITVSLQKQEKQ